ncbi:N-methyl-L-tryptophan oxidase [Halorussus lipolyticus]|uniref:N-methyl-L-tryptophan oxidase n=1 Tax=Halorussus lipolyticus TaxID=3034024 RepID=UPI0023E76A79|nr:N-methyl-L-tryptophan oxidase [Halorussus sp. DT80]
MTETTPATDTADADRRDVIVVGIGGMGSASAYHLADRGLDVLGFERHNIPHSQGSSHGYTRIIRLAYYEHPSYVPLLRAAYDEWADLADETGADLLHQTGSLAVGPPDSDIFEGARRTCREHGLDHDVLSGGELNERFPGYDVPDEYRAVFQPQGGFLVPEDCITAHVEGAFARGAEIHARTKVRDWTALDDGGVRVKVERRGTTEVHEADSLVVAAGAWTGKLLPELAPVLEPERQVLGWFQPEERARFSPDTFPVFSMRCDDGEYIYGFPVHRVPGFKIGKYNHRRETVDPDEMEREPTPTDEAILREYTESYFDGADGPTTRLETCLFTNSPDERFVIDTHPEHPQVAVAGGFSGHGFKFSSVVGDILADLVVEGETDHPIEQFAIDRFDNLNVS